MISMPWVEQARVRAMQPEESVSLNPPQNRRVDFHGGTVHEISVALHHRVWCAGYVFQEAEDRHRVGVTLNIVHLLDETLELQWLL